MKLIYTAVLTLVTMTTANPIIDTREEAVGPVCGTQICQAAASKYIVQCPFTCQQRPCARYSCPGHKYDMVCGKDGKSCVALPL
jgi:hypothetical protein